MPEYPGHVPHASSFRLARHGCYVTLRDHPVVPVNKCERDPYGYAYRPAAERVFERLEGACPLSTPSSRGLNEVILLRDEFRQANELRSDVR